MVVGKARLGKQSRTREANAITWTIAKIPTLQNQTTEDNVTYKPQTPYHSHHHNRHYSVDTLIVLLFLLPLKTHVTVLHASPSQLLSASSTSLKIQGSCSGLVEPKLCVCALTAKETGKQYLNILH